MRSVLLLGFAVLCGCVTEEMQQRQRDYVALKVKRERAAKLACANMPDITKEPDFDPTSDDYVEVDPDCTERTPTPQQRCKLIVEKFKTDYFECVKYYDAKQERVTERRHSRQDAEDDAGDHAIADALTKSAEGFKPAPTTTCTTRPDGYGGVKTVCQ